jgi:cephalosporin hydroxylase
MNRLMGIAADSEASQEAFEIYWMLQAVAELEPKVIVEIGVHKGGFLKTLREAFPTAMLIGVDIDLSLLEFNDAYFIKGDSYSTRTVCRYTDLINGSNKKVIDFLWIDGDHHYEAAKHDFALWSPFVRPGGIIGFHDTNSRGIEGVEVDKFMKELDDNFSYPTLDLLASNMAPGTRLIWK